MPAELFVFTKYSYEVPGTAVVSLNNNELTPTVAISVSLRKILYPVPPLTASQLTKTLFVKLPSLAATPVGAGNTNVNALGKLVVPTAVVTATLFAPALPAGVTAVMLVDETTFTLVAATPPTVTLVAPVKFVPVMVISVPPRVVPEDGLTPEIVGVGTTNVNALGTLAVPPAVVTATLFAPSVPAGVTAVMFVDETTFTLVAATPPTVTLLAPVKFVPVMVIAVPPRVVPDDGLTLEIVGSGTT